MDEFSPEEWARRPEKLRISLALHQCGEGRSTCRVFRCRANRKLPYPVACGRYVGACLGGSDDDRCADCHGIYMDKLKKALFSRVKKAKWRGEVSLCLHFGGKKNHIATEDALYELVREGKLAWFGKEDRPLRYRARRRRHAH